MPNNNPSGANSFDHFAQEQPYGQILQEKNLAQAGPLAGTGGSLLDAPRRASRAAKRPPPPPEGSVSPVQGQPQVSAQAQVAAFWQQAAQIPGASPLVQQLAVQAASGG